VEQTLVGPLCASREPRRLPRVVRREDVSLVEQRGAGTERGWHRRDGAVADVSVVVCSLVASILGSRLSGAGAEIVISHVGPSETPTYKQ